MRWSVSTWSRSPKRSTESISEIAAAIVQARRDGKTLNSRSVHVDPAQAYTVQHHVLGQLRPDEEIVGFKLGYTSDVMRQVMGIDEPNHGPLLRSMLLASPARVHSLIQPKVEPEIAIRVDERGSIAEYLASVEVVDSVWSDYDFTWAHNTADGSSAAFAIIGEPIAVDVDRTCVTLTSSSGRTQVAAVRDVRPDIDGSLEWLAHHPELPRRLRAGDIVLTGGLTAPLNLEPGGWIMARFDAPGWSTEVRVERRESG